MPEAMADAPEVKKRLPLAKGWPLFRRFKAYLGPERKLAITIGVLLAIVVPAGILSPLLVRRLFDEAIPAKDLSLLLRLGAVVIGLTLFSQAVGFAEGLLAIRLQNRIRYRVARELVEHVLRLPLAFLRKTETGYLMSRVRDDVASLGALMTDRLLQAAIDAVRAVLFFVLLLWIDFALALSGLLLVAVITGGVLLMSGRLRRQAEAMREADAKSSAALQEALAGSMTVKTAGREPAETRRFTATVRAAIRAAVGHEVLGLATGSALGLVGSLGLYVIVCVGAYRIFSGLSTYGTLMAFFIYLTQLVGAASSVLSLNPAVQKALASLERIFGLMDETAEARGALAMPRLRGEVEFENVSFEYEAGREVLHGVSFRARPGEVVALVGPSGSGKSTLVSLLARLYDPTSGTIRVDGREISSYPLRSLRRQIGVVPQDVFLFNRTIRENIAFARPDATDEELRAAARAAHAAEFVEKLPKGYETMVGERGVRLSGGEKQRLAIAREVLRDPPLLVLDEATSSLDSESEALVRDAIEALKKERTSFVIAHRLSTVVSADTILVLENGRVVESGRHADLLARGGRYRDLYETQFRSALR
jgi:subfamily B ATP-binding cassette protein MsbA